MVNSSAGIDGLLKKGASYLNFRSFQTGQEAPHHLFARFEGNVNRPSSGEAGNHPAQAMDVLAQLVQERLVDDHKQQPSWVEPHDDRDYSPKNP
jgi:hypothetical protein